MHSSFVSRAKIMCESDYYSTFWFPVRSSQLGSVRLGLAWLPIQSNPVRDAVILDARFLLLSRFRFDTAVFCFVVDEVPKSTSKYMMCIVQITASNLAQIVVLCPIVSYRVRSYYPAGFFYHTERDTRLVSSPSSFLSFLLCRSGYAECRIE